MEESVNDIETNQSFRSPPRRRRSTFFERRESFAPQATESTKPNVCKQTETPNEDLTRYYNKLLVEKGKWKNEVNNRRNKYYDLRQQYKIALNAPVTSRMCYSALTNEDIQFLDGKSNISKLVDSQLKLHKSVKETRALYRRASELDDVILSHCESKVKQITEYIFENSTVEPKETDVTV